MLEGVDLEVRAGQFASLVGPSGSGKTSVLRAVMELQPMRAGEVELDVDRKDVGLLFQDDALLPWRTARQNVALGLRIHGATPKGADERDARRPEMRRLAAALAKGLADTRTIPSDEVIAALPGALLAGGDVDRLRDIIERYRLSLYPESVAIDPDAARRVVRAQEISRLLSPGSVDLSILLDTDALSG